MTRYDERFVESLRDEIEAQDEKLKKLKAAEEKLKKNEDKLEHHAQVDKAKASMNDKK